MKTLFDNIKEVINFEITNVKKNILEYEHITVFGNDFYKPGDCFNHKQNAETVLSEYQKILDFVLKCEKENPWFVFEPITDENHEEFQKRIDESFKKKRGLN